MDGNKTVTANFTILPTYKLTTAVSPTGGGTISPAGVNTYYSGTIVPVTASANTGYIFSGWSGACTSSGTCSVTMDGDKTVTANFNPAHKLTIAVAPAGAGTTAPTVGVHSYTVGTVVSVSATAAPAGYKFDHWSYACTGSGACSVTMDADKSVTANFTAVTTYRLTTAVNRTSRGTIDPSPGLYTYNSGDIVVVTATAYAGCTFTGWNGPCTGNPCSLRMNSNKSITANFSRP
jgi:uncharacterized repeat protein (TIGR02543 family)